MCKFFGYKIPSFPNCCNFWYLSSGRTAMPNRDAHLRVGAVSGAAYATYHAWGQPGPYVLAEAGGGPVGGIGGGLFPGRIDTPCSPAHRAGARSMRITGTVGYFMNPHLQQRPRSLRPDTPPHAHLPAGS